MRFFAEKLATRVPLINVGIGRGLKKARRFPSAEGTQIDDFAFYGLARTWGELRGTPEVYANHGNRKMEEEEAQRWHCAALMHDDDDSRKLWYSLKIMKR